jgi:hypothetical protein
VSPDTLVEGASITLRGADFSSTASANVVTIDGATATVTAATATQLTVTVPTSDCRPQRTVDVRVSRGGNTSNTLNAPVKPAAFVDVGVGEQIVLDDPADFCLQFPPAAAGAGEYLVGIGSAAERPDVLFDVTLAGVTGHAAPAAVASAATSTSGGAQVATPAGPAHALSPAGPPHLLAAARPSGQYGPPAATGAPTPDGWDWHTRAQQRMSRLTREALDRARTEGMSVAGAFADRPLGSAGVTPEVGDRIEIKVATFAGTTLEEACTPIPITTEVRVVGERAIFVTDLENPPAGALTDGEIQAFSDAFDAFIYDADTEYFGTPLDQDENQRILAVLTVEINKAGEGLIEDVSGVVWLLDFLDPSLCPASNRGELAYFSVPDPDNGLGKAPYIDAYLPVLAHEFAHIVQHSVRLSQGAENSVSLTTWEAEGQATLAMEIVGHAALGLTPRQDYGAATVWSQPGATWYVMLDRLAMYYGYDDGGRNADAPETCSLFLSSASDPNTRDSVGCHLPSAYGASWSFFRYLTDRYGPDWPGGEAGLMRDWIDLNPTLQGAANVEALLGRPFQELFAEWAAMHWVDAHVPDADPALLLTSWDLGDILPALDAHATLEPWSRTFSDFDASLSVRGGSTAYNLFGDEAARPATALRVRNGSGGVLGSDMRPVLWVVRTR